MKCEEIVQNYQISDDLIQFYVKKTKKADYDEQDVCLLGELATLRQCNFSLEAAWQYLGLKTEKQNQQCSYLLTQKRQGILQEIHEKERILAQLDCMKFELDKKKEETI